MPNERATDPAPPGGDHRVRGGRARGRRHGPGAGGELVRPGRGRPGLARGAGGARWGGSRAAGGRRPVARDRGPGAAPSGLGDALLLHPHPDAPRHRRPAAGAAARCGSGRDPPDPRPARSRALNDRPGGDQRGGRPYLRSQDRGHLRRRGVAPSRHRDLEGVQVVALVDPADPGVTLLESDSSGRPEPAHRRPRRGRCGPAGRGCGADPGPARPSRAGDDRSGRGRGRPGPDRGLHQGAHPVRAQPRRSSRPWPCRSPTSTSPRAPSTWPPTTRSGGFSRGCEAWDDLAVAAYWVCDQAPPALRICHHLHGGMGVDETYPLHHFFSWVNDIAHDLGALAGSVSDRGPGRQEPRADRGAARPEGPTA